MSSPLPNSAPLLAEATSDGDKTCEAGSVVPVLTPIVTLPQRRVAADSATACSPADRVGLRIESHIQRAGPSASPSRIDVQEINGDFTRLDQVTPAPQKVPRQVKFHELPTREEGETSTSEEGAQWGVEKQRSSSWIIGAGIAVAGIVVLCLILLPLVNSSYASRKERPAIPSIASKPIAQQVDPIARQVNPLEGQSAEALRIFLSYAAATTLEEALPHLREHETLADLLKENWQPMRIPEKWQPTETCDWLVGPPDRKPYAILCGFLPDQSDFSTYFIHDGQRLLIDWKATTAYSTARFVDLAKAQGNPDEIRGIISACDFYNNTWPEKDYQSFKFISPDKNTTLWCYTHRGDPTDLGITQILLTVDGSGNIPKSRRVTVKLASGPVEKLPNQWLIRELLHLDWSHP